jgi:hypothetical protein
MCQNGEVIIANVKQHKNVLLPELIKNKLYNTFSFYFIAHFMHKRIMYILEEVVS